MKAILSIMFIFNLAYAVKLPEFGKSFTAKYKQIKTLKKMDGLELESSGTLDVKNAKKLSLNQVKPFESLTVISNGQVKTTIKGKTSTDRNKSSAVVNNILLALIKADEKELKRYFVITEEDSKLVLTPRDKEMRKVIKTVELSFGENESQILVKEVSQNEILFKIIDYKKQK
jgi:hypothetical protein